MSKNTKTQAKRMGVKSAFAYGEGRNLAITSFGRGNQANLEVNTDARGSDLHLPYKADSFMVKSIDEEIGLSRGKLESLLNNPAEACDTEDYLGLKGTLENEVFGKAYPNDTVRIQIIHNILDIQKILGLYVNDIIYCINNLQENEIPEDRIGLGLGDDKAKELLHKMQSFLSFFGDAFQLPGKKETSASQPDRTVEHNIDVLRILGTIRQQTIHFKDISFFFVRDLDENFHKKEGKWEIIQQNYRKLTERINKDFLEHSAMNLQILFEIFSAETPEAKIQLTEEYYRFSILKEGKNLGVNMTKIRERIIEAFCPGIKGKTYDSFRSKLYTIADFILFRKLSAPGVLDKWVQQLRRTSDEEAKEALYEAFSKTVWKKTQPLIEPFFKRYSRGFMKTEKAMLSPSMIEKVCLKADGEPFVQMMAFLCNFWEGKEVNEILSAYIHKFENIQAFLDTLHELGEEVTFTNFTLFNEPGMAERIAAQLRVLASIGKMKPDLSAAKRPLYKAAIETLGINDSKYITDEWLADNVLLGKEATEERKKDVNPFRNFIAGNVIGSRRFMYLVRYTKPKITRALMGNIQIVHYVLTRLPEKQIESYYGNISSFLDEKVPLQTKINRLASKLTRFSFQDYLKNTSNIIANSQREKNVEIERLKALTGLYLTVAYVAVKNLIKANARYYIAFWALDRDYHLLLKKDKETLDSLCIKYGENEKQKHNEALALTEYYLKKEGENDYKPAPGQLFDKEVCRRHLDSIRRHFSKKWREIFRKQIAEALAIDDTGYFPIYFRNDAAHLNVLSPKTVPFISQFRARQPGMQSYFELYHFLLQMKMFKSESVTFNLPEEYRKFLDSGVPCLDIIKIAYVSLGYNLPRYKNLTTEALFDEDSKTGKERANRRKG